MKKGFLLLTTAALVGTAATAQIRFAPEVGLNISKLRYEAPSNVTTKYTTEWKFGPKVGVNAEIPITTKFSFAPGLQYTMKGGEYDYDTKVAVAGITTETDVKNKWTFHYVELPMNFMYHLREIGEGGLFFNFGPYAAAMVGGGYATDVKTKVTTGTTSNETQTKTDGNLKVGNAPTDNVRNFDLGANIGIGYELRSGLFFRGQYGMSINDIHPDIPGDPSMRNNTLSLSVGYWFGRN